MLRVIVRKKQRRGGGGKEKTPIICTILCRVLGEARMEKYRTALAGVSQLVGASSCTPKGGGSIPGQGIYLGFRFNPRSERLWEATN